MAAVSQSSLLSRSLVPSVLTAFGAVATFATANPGASALAAGMAAALGTVAALGPNLLVSLFDREKEAQEQAYRLAANGLLAGALGRAAGTLMTEAAKLSTTSKKDAKRILQAAKDFPGAWMALVEDPSQLDLQEADAQSLASDFSTHLAAEQGGFLSLVLWSRVLRSKLVLGDVHGRSLIAMETLLALAERLAGPDLVKRFLTELAFDPEAAADMQMRQLAGLQAQLGELFTTLKKTAEQSGFTPETTEDRAALARFLSAVPASLAAIQVTQAQHGAVLSEIQQDVKEVLAATLGDARRALECYEQAMKIAQEIGDRQGEANTHFNSALALWSLADAAPEAATATAAAAQRAAARSRMAQARDLFTAMESPHAATAEAELAAWA
jgi:tetratricopeptide (TPR) repeat protein